jgi:hypothetical protein
MNWYPSQIFAAILQKDLFTTSAVDNIDYNPSATTATISCHGSGISVFQHPVSSTFSDSRTFEFKGQKPKSKAISCLPETYTNVKPAFLKSKPNPPILQTTMSMSDLDYLVHFTCKIHDISIVTGRNKCWSNIFFKNQ